MKIGDLIISSKIKLYLMVKIFRTCDSVTVYPTTKSRKTKLTVDILNFILYFKINQFSQRTINELS